MSEKITIIDFNNSLLLKHPKSDCAVNIGEGNLKFDNFYCIAINEPSKLLLATANHLKVNKFRKFLIRLMFFNFKNPNELKYQSIPE